MMRLVRHLCAVATILLLIAAAASAQLATAELNGRVTDSSGAVLPGATVTATLPNFQAMIANDKDFLATRVAYKLNLRGPAVTVQTACSTSLVAVHLACQSLWSGECDMALAGGVSVFFPQKSGHLYHEGMIASPDGHCRPFDASAQGTIKGNGAGVVVLKRLTDALTDGDAIRAVILGSAINNDGSLKLGYTAPSVDGQAGVIAEALSLAGISPETIGFVEAHGTGTLLGDPIEIAALTQVFRDHTQASGYCAIGSLKSNVGHLDTAAGVGSLIKTVLALENRQIPPTVHFERPNPQIDFAGSPFYVNSRLVEWSGGEAPRRAAVSSFGIGGTNAHVVVEEAPALEAVEAGNDESPGPCMLPISARSSEALAASVQAYEQLLSGSGSSALRDICYSASVRRSHHDLRLAVLGSSAADLVACLKAFREQTPITASARGGFLLGSTRENRVRQESLQVAPESLLEAARAYVAGRTPESSGGRYVRLPAYPWQRHRYWIEPSRRRQATASIDAHPLLGAALRSPALSALVWEAALSANEPRYLDDHRVFGTATFPAAGYVEMALAAAKDLAIHDISFSEPLRFEAGKRRVVQVVLESAAVRIFSRPESEDQWTLHASATLRPRVVVTTDSLESRRSQCSTPWPGDVYAQAHERGVDYGPAFRGLVHVWHGPGQALGEIRAPEEVANDPGGDILHPAILDACLQVAGVALLSSSESRDTYIPFAIDTVELKPREGDSASGGVTASSLWSHARIHSGSPTSETFRADIDVFAADGSLLAAIRGLVLKRAGAPIHRGRNARSYEIIWTKRTPAPAIEVSPAPWLIVSEDDNAADFIAHLEMAGPPCRRINANEVAQALKQEPQCRTAVLLWPTCRDALHVIQAINRSASQPLDLFIVTRGLSEDAPLLGLARTVHLENPGLRCTTIDNPQAHQLCAAILSSGREDHIAFRDGEMVVPRLIEHRSVPRNYQLGIRRRGVLDNLEFSSSGRRVPARGEVEIRVRATGLNFRDVLTVLDMYPGESSLGGECSGTVTAVGDGVKEFKTGDAVIAVTPGAFSAFVISPVHCVVRKPENLSFVEAASVPMVFLTAWYGLKRLAGIHKGDKVLIHAAAGGVGLAAVQIARAAGAEVFATAGSEEKRQYLRSLGIEHVFDSRSLDFSKAIRASAGPQPIDIVLNSLAGNFIRESASLVRPGGRFLELGKRDIWSQEDARRERPDIGYLPYDLADVGRRDPQAFHALLAEVIEAFDAGHYQPLPRKVFRIQEAADAFRYMAQARHIGKIVVVAPAETSVLENATYLITGGAGGLGLQLAQWLVQRGARHLVLAARSDPSDAARQTAAELAGLGAHIEFVRANAGRREDVESLLSRIGKDRPLRGVFHAAGIVADGLLGDQTWERFEAVFEAKVAGARHLDDLTRGLKLDFFVLFSSMASLFGAPGQANYAAANACLDALAHKRREEGLPALAVNWGPWAGSGMAARTPAAHQARRKAQGIELLEPDDALKELEDLMAKGITQAAVLNVDWKTFLRHYREEDTPALLAEIAGQYRSTTSAGHDVQTNLRMVLDETPPARRRAFLLSQLRDIVVQVLGLRPSQSLDEHQGLSDLGMDSLMAVELRNRLQQNLDISLPSTLSYDYPTLDALTGYLMKDILRYDAEPAFPASHELEVRVKAGESEDSGALVGDDLAAALERELAGVDELLGEHS